MSVTEFLDACCAYRDQAALSPEETVSVTEFLDACCAYRDQAALSPEETVSVTEFLDACLTGTKWLCHQRKW